MSRHSRPCPTSGLGLVVLGWRMFAVTCLISTRRDSGTHSRSQKFQNGRADDEWARLEKTDIESVAYLDEHPGLGVLETTKGK